MLKTLYCELDIHDGDEAMILERNLLKIKRKEIPALRKELGIIFQDFQLLHDRNVYKNLQFVLKATGWKNKKKSTNELTKCLRLSECRTSNLRCHTNFQAENNSA